MERSPFLVCSVNRLQDLLPPKLSVTPQLLRPRNCPQNHSQKNPPSSQKAAPNPMEDCAGLTPTITSWMKVYLVMHALVTEGSHSTDTHNDCELILYVANNIVGSLILMFIWLSYIHYSCIRSTFTHAQMHQNNRECAVAGTARLLQWKDHKPGPLPAGIH